MPTTTTPGLLVRVGALALATTTLLLPASPALAKTRPGGFGGGTSSSSKSHYGSSSSGSKTGSRSTYGTGSSSNRNRVNAPSTSGGTGSTTTNRSNGTTGTGTNSRNRVNAPSNSGSTATQGNRTVPDVVSNSGKGTAPTTSYQVPTTTRVKSKSYTAPGSTYTYRYQNPSYYRRITVYPTYGTPAYWTLLNDPYYYNNYRNTASPWYGHAYPAGYTVQNGSFVQSHQHHYLRNFLIFLLVVGAGIGLFLFIKRRTAAASAPGSFANSF